MNAAAGVLLAGEVGVFTVEAAVLGHEFGHVPTLPSGTAWPWYLGAVLAMIMGLLADELGTEIARAASGTTTRRRYIDALLVVVGGVCIAGLATPIVSDATSEAIARMLLAALLFVGGLVIAVQRHS